MGSTCSTNGRDDTLYNISVGKSGGKRPFGRLSRSWEDNIRMYLREIE